MSERRPIRVFAADGEPLTLRGLASLFENESDIKLVGQAGDSDEALRLISELKPDVAVLDLQLPGQGAMHLLASLKTHIPRVRAVILRKAFTHTQFVNAIRLGVSGLLIKTMPASLVLSCVRTVHAGKEFIERDGLLEAFGKLLRHDHAEKELAELISEREFAVLKHAVNGLSNKLIARELNISEGTVKVHLHRTYEKLHVHGRVDLLRLAHQKGLA